jgi:hypothetical protein
VSARIAWVAKIFFWQFLGVSFKIPFSVSPPILIRVVRDGSLAGVRMREVFGDYNRNASKRAGLASKVGN